MSEAMGHKPDILSESQSPISIQELGTIKEATGINPGDQEGVWTGKISVANMTPELREKAEHFTSPSFLAKYYVPVSDFAPTRCIDGRPVEGFEDIDHGQDRQIGPQVPGGTPLSALAMRLVHGIREIESGEKTFIDDINDTSRLYLESGILLGGHIDDHAPEGRTGCGAIDEIPQELEKFASVNAFMPIRNLTSAILGSQFEDDIFSLHFSHAVALRSRLDSYLLHQGDDYGYRPTVIQAIRDASHRRHTPVEKLVGPHREAKILVNFAKGLTFDRDRFARDTGNEVQVFNYDYWRSREIAHTLYPITIDMPRAPQQEQINNRFAFKHARVATAVATLQVLTDGSLPLSVVSLPEAA